MPEKNNDENKKKERPFTGTPEEQLPDLEGEQVQSERTEGLTETKKRDPEENED